MEKGKRQKSFGSWIKQVFTGRHLIKDEFFKRGLRQLKNWMGNNPSNSRLWKCKKTIYSAQNETGFSSEKKWNHMINTAWRTFTRIKLRLHWYSLMFHCLVTETSYYFYNGKVKQRIAENNCHTCDVQISLNCYAWFTISREDYFYNIIVFLNI